jgi:hypothetical protein
MRNLTDDEQKGIWDEMRAEFPDDRVMQEVHFARLVHHEMLRGESAQSRSAFYHEQAAKVLGKTRGHRRETPA